MYTSLIKCLSNIKIGIMWAAQAIKRGYVPFCPFLDFLFNLVGKESLTDAEFKAYSMEWVYSCDEIWLLPNWKDSPGAIAELKVAEGRNMKVVYL